MAGSSDSRSPRDLDVAAGSNAINRTDHSDKGKCSTSNGDGSRRKARNGAPVEKDCRSNRRRGKVVVTCEGCNEEGHAVGECPHRSDSAMEESDSSSSGDGGSSEGESEEAEDDDEEYEDD